MQIYLCMIYKGKFASVGPYLWSLKTTLEGVSGPIIVQAKDCSESIIKQWRNTGRHVKYLMSEYACTQFNNLIKFKNMKKFMENLGWLSTISKKYKTNALILKRT